ncbi:MAG: GIY-YIG nuclease family protein [Prosthecochloris sp.]|nr:GIY-YIG nuclease family protein [Prosthecochloris sp.]
MGYVYLIRNGGLHKIGITTDMAKRMEQLKPDEIIEYKEMGVNYKDYERNLHRKYAHCRLPQTEYFRLSDSEVIEVSEYLADSGEYEESDDLGCVAQLLKFVLIVIAVLFLLFLLANYFFGEKRSDNSVAMKNSEGSSELFVDPENNAQLEGRNFLDLKNNNVFVWSEMNGVDNDNYQNSLKRLDVVTYANGDAIRMAQSDAEWKQAIKQREGAYCIYENDFEKYYFYNKYAVNDHRGIAPKGWHVPSIEEWEYIISIHGEGFHNIVGTGMRESDGEYSRIKKNAYFWVSDKDGKNRNIKYNVKRRSFSIESGSLITGNNGRGYAVGVISD